MIGKKLRLPPQKNLLQQRRQKRREKRRSDNKSVHLTEIKPLNYDFSKEIINGDKMIDIISGARGEKSNNNLSLKTPIKILELGVNEELKDGIESSIKDFKATLFIQELKLNETVSEYKINNIELETQE